MASFWVGREVTWVGQQRGDVLTSGIAFLSFHHRHNMTRGLRLTVLDDSYLKTYQILPISYTCMLHNFCNRPRSEHAQVPMLLEAGLELATSSFRGVCANHYAMASMVIVRSRQFWPPLAWHSAETTWIVFLRQIILEQCHFYMIWNTKCVTSPILKFVY